GNRPHAARLAPHRRIPQVPHDAGPGPPLHGRAHPLRAEARRRGRLTGGPSSAVTAGVRPLSMNVHGGAVCRLPDNPNSRRNTVAGEFRMDVEAIRRRAREKMSEGAITDAYKADRRQVIGVLNEVLATETVCFL